MCRQTLRHRVHPATNCCYLLTLRYTCCDCRFECIQTCFNVWTTVSLLQQLLHASCRAHTPAHTHLDPFKCPIDVVKRCTVASGTPFQNGERTRGSRTGSLSRPSGMYNFTFWESMLCWGIRSCVHSTARGLPSMPVRILPPRSPTAATPLPCKHKQ